MRTGFAIVLLLLGIALMAVSFCWRPIASTRFVWNEQQARDLNDASARLHELSERATQRTASDTHDPEFETERQAAIDRFKTIQAEFDSARRFRNYGGHTARWIGVVAAFLGTGILLARRHGK